MTDLIDRLISAVDLNAQKQAAERIRELEVERAAYRAGIWEEAAAFCAAARDGIDFASLTESAARQEGAFDMADHLTATFKQMAESARRRVVTEGAMQ